MYYIRFLLHVSALRGRPQGEYVQRGAWVAWLLGTTGELNSTDTKRNVCWLFELFKLSSFCCRWKRKFLSLNPWQMRTRLLNSRMYALDAVKHRVWSGCCVTGNYCISAMGISWSHLTVTCCVGNFGKVWCACGQREIEHTEWSMNKYRHAFTCVFFCASCGIQNILSQQPNGGRGRLIRVVYRSPTMTHHSRWTSLDVWSACRRDLYVTTHSLHKRQTYMSPAGF